MENIHLDGDEEDELILDDGNTQSGDFVRKWEVFMGIYDIVDGFSRLM